MYGRLEIALLPLVALIVACSVASKPSSPPPPDAFGCQPPPPDVFTQVGVDFDLAKSTFGDIVTGALDIKAKPEVVSLASKATTNRRIRVYLRCLAVKQTGYSLEQAAYFDVFADFVSRDPTADQVLRWQESNPFPGPVPERDSLRLVIRTMPGAVITIIGSSGRVGSVITGAEGQARIEIPKDFEGTEIEIKIDLKGFMSQSQRVVAEDGVVVVFEVVPQ